MEVVRFAYFVTVYQISTSAKCTTLTLNLKMGQTWMQRCQSKARPRPFKWRQSDVCHICHHLRHIRNRNERDLDWPLEWATVECKHADQKRRYDFIYDGNCNVFPICHYLRDIRNGNMNDPDLTFGMSQGQLTWPLEWAKVRFKSTPKPIHYFLYDGNSNVLPCQHLHDIHAQSIMVLALTVTIGQGQINSNANMPIESPYTTFYDDSINVCPIYHHLRDSQWKFP